MTKFFVHFILLSSVCLFCVSCANPTFPSAKFGNEQAIHMVETGHGPPVILIPGLFGTHNGWDRMIPFLADRYQLLAIDNFGTGDSARPVDSFGYSVAEQADKIVAMMDELDIMSCDLIGVSYGGMIALNIAARYPDRVDTVVCIEGGVIMPKDSPYRRLEQGLKYSILGDVIIGFIRSGLFDESMAKGIMGHSWEDLSSEDMAEVTGIISKNAKAASRLSWLGLAHALNFAEDFTEQAKAITAPVLYLSGAKSSFRDMTGRNIAFFKDYLPHVQMISFEDGIHDLELQKPKETAAMIIDFFEQNASRPLLDSPLKVTVAH